MVTGDLGLLAHAQSLVVADKPQGRETVMILPLQMEAIIAQVVPVDLRAAIHKHVPLVIETISDSFILL